ncbi:MULTISPECIES: jacalin-like lectin [Streptomyces]|uniref:Endonuclease/Exonuclease/phosphatase family protein n=1 Tax=Streptomyces chartreusis NRRL 3882 TaxID=1079985 RepID=A0A2N9B4E3_STRCX|nr:MULTISPECIES: jacalin-like lectin [Streptomyces]MYS95679.1 endonuclease [Streptomyces sp. SID5464]SOR78219.1 Endonuclease/Exonuclease/phosphatase family protein [Streptomyces chartreusis NRRL 3882]
MRRLLGTLAAAALTLTGLTATSAAPAAAADSGSFNVLTYNIAGLPLGLGDSDPETNTPLIGQRLGPYDIVNVQEDFNYHASLYANDKHPYRTATSGGAAFGDGLNTLSDHPFEDFQRVKWKDCTGTNCLTPKGFSLARVRIAEGVFVDLYNVHTNADSTDDALAARRANVEQLSDFIQENSAGNAVIVMGDTNTRYTRTGDNIRTLLSENGLTDAWVKLVKGGTPPAQGGDALVCDAAAPANDCEVVDKVLYRGSKLLTLTATRYANDWKAFLRSDGKHLSDHFPHTVDFSYTLNPSLRASDFFGGPHGTAFNDADDLPANPAPRTLTLRGGTRLDAVSLTHDGGTALTHGGTGGTAASLTLAPGEHLTSVRLTQGQKDGRTRIFSATFTTDRNRTLSAGTATSDAKTFTAPSGWRIVGFTGRAGGEIDKLGVVYAPIR